MLEAFLGADGGGTSLRACILTGDGTIVSSATGETANWFSVGSEDALRNLAAIVEQCVSSMPRGIQLARASFALAGVSTRRAAYEARAALGRSQVPGIAGCECDVTNDTLAALWEGTSNRPAIALVAGTGSHCLGLSTDGSVERASGLEYVLSDEGGAYYIGARMLRAVATSCDGRGPATRMTPLLFTKLGVSSIADVFDAFSSLKRVKLTVSGLAPIVSEAAALGDVAAQHILDDAIDSLIAAVDAVARKLHFGEQKIDFIGVGALWMANEYIRTGFESRLKRTYNVRGVTYSVNASAGAAKLARDRPAIDIWSCYERKHFTAAW